MEIKRICKQCGIEKDINLFHKSKVNKGGRRPICAECFNYNVQNPVDRFLIEMKWQLLAIGIKYCPSCNGYLSDACFDEDKNRKDGLRCYCHECGMEQGRVYCQTEGAKLKKRERESHPDFLPRLNEYRRNSSKYKKTYTNYRATSPVYKTFITEYNKRINRRLRNKISSYIYAELKSQNTKKGLGFNEYLGCTIDFFREYIASKFIENMTWDNWGKGADKWNLDHILPCASFNLEDEDQQRACFHYTNQQPLWEYDNLSKNSKVGGVRMYHKK